MNQALFTGGFPKAHLVWQVSLGSEQTQEVEITSQCCN